MGFNEYGQLSDNTTKNKPSPVFVMSGVERADISDTHAMIIDKYGTLFAAGDNSYSQLGNKNAISSTELTKVMQGVRDVAVGNYFSLVLTVNGELYSAGTNEKGQLGNNGGEFRAELVPVMTGVEKISVNGNTCAALPMAESCTYGVIIQTARRVPKGLKLLRLLKKCRIIFMILLCRKTALPF